MKKNPSLITITPPPPQRAKPRSPIAIALSVILFPIWFPFWAYGVFLAAQFDRTRDFSKWLQGRYECYRYGGFTLIELSMVLVIVGLLLFLSVLLAPAITEAIVPQSFPSEATPVMTPPRSAHCERSSLSGLQFIQALHDIVAHGDLTDIPFIEMTLKTHLAPYPGREKSHPRTIGFVQGILDLGCCD